MKRLKLWSLLGLILVCCLAFMTACDDSDSSASADDTNPNGDVSASLTNIIFMVPDGMGLSNVTAARIYKNGVDGDPLYMETLPFIGYQRTHARNSTVTDSAAAASAWASGDKFNNGEISCIDDDGDGQCDGTRVNEKTILELAQDQGMATGLVATSDITHATPAVWGAHVHSRYCGQEIFRQLIAHDIDVLLGGGVAENREGRCALPQTDDDLIGQAMDAGYTYATTASEMTAGSDASKLLGLFNQGGLTPLYIRSANSTQPTLNQMTETALTILEKDPEGFFLMVEGSQIDWANHANDIKYQLEESVDFDNAVKTVLDWIAEKPEREAQTLLVVVADHDTAGFAVNGPYGRQAVSGETAEDYYLQARDYETGEIGDPEYVFDEDGFSVMAPDIQAGWTSGDHTAVDTLIWSNSPAFARPMDNTDLYGIMKTFMQ